VSQSDAGRFPEVDWTPIDRVCSKHSIIEFNDSDLSVVNVWGRPRHLIHDQAAPCSPYTEAAFSTRSISPASSISLGVRLFKRGFLLTKNAVCIH